MKFNEGQSTAEIPPVTIRRLGADDAAAVTRLARLDNGELVANGDEVAGATAARAPSGELIGAELDGHLVAAISTTTGEAIADPFRRTVEIVEVLRLRTSQLNGSPTDTRRPRLLSLLRPARRRAAGVVRRSLVALLLDPGLA
jgi:hypothetical protein